MELSTLIQEHLSLVESWMSETHSPNVDNPTLKEACHYSLSSGGKRIRPIFSLLVAELFQINKEQLRSFVIAVEMVHTSSLIHDDLPALDNDDLRRGRATCHRVYGEGPAILAGDTLIAAAFSTIASAVNVSAEEKLSWVEILSAATRELCDGQTFDLDLEDPEKRRTLLLLSQETQVETILRCHRKKTAALFQASALGPAVLLKGEGRAQGISFAKLLGEELGLLFQITDDLLDFKEVGEEEFSLVSILGVEDTKALIREKEGILLNALSPYGSQGNAIADLIRHLARREV